jgi:hypothetical protein
MAHHGKKAYPPVSWARSANGFIPHYRFRGMHALGPERPWPQMLQGEQMTVARYFLCLICETLYGVAPLKFDMSENGQDFTNPAPNPEWDELPYMIENPEYPHNSACQWVMNDGNPDVLGMFDHTKQAAIKAASGR